MFISKVPLNKKITLLTKFVWPANSLLLQFYVLISVLTLATGRVTNIYVPTVGKKIVDSLVSSSSKIDEPLLLGVFRWDLILTLVCLKIVQGRGSGGAGLLTSLRSLLWIQVQQYTTREADIAFIRHIHGLSFHWHQNRKTGEVLQAMNRGTVALNGILNYILFNIFPAIADIVIAIVYLSMTFNYRLGLIVFITTILFMSSTFALADLRAKYRRSMNQADNARKQQEIDSLLNFEAVKYFVNEEFEVECYTKSLSAFLVEERRLTGLICVMNVIQVFVINLGLLVGALFCVSLIVDVDSDSAGGEYTAGDYVLFTTYMTQLHSPLYSFGTNYRLLQRAFTDVESMLEIFCAEPDVVDNQDASELHISKGDGTIEFRNVTFGFDVQDDRPVLRNLSFTVPAGSTAALIGPSGAGKSTIINLLLRLYDPINGEILIDGQNINRVTQASLRRAIGVVPQDTLLFNNTVNHNIKYGRIGSDDEHVISAAQVSCMHERILTFPFGYDSRVGERGMKLSGGEKQRISIARAVLKSPAIILLDEASSALDTNTERKIQRSLETLCTNRTTLIVAHRLSTVVHVDQILVLSNGSIVEEGKHFDLLKMGGLYAEMWMQQLNSDNPTVLKKTLRL